MEVDLQLDQVGSILGKHPKPDGEMQEQAAAGAGGEGGGRER